jgi:hypothetical protein
LSAPPEDSPAALLAASLAFDRDRRRPAQEDLDAVDAYELSAAYFLEGIVLDHLRPFKPHHHNQLHHNQHHGREDHPRRRSEAEADDMWSPKEGEEQPAAEPIRVRRPMGRSDDEATKRARMLMASPESGGRHAGREPSSSPASPSSSSSSSSPMLWKRLRHSEDDKTKHHLNNSNHHRRHQHPHPHQEEEDHGVSHQQQQDEGAEDADPELADEPGLYHEAKKEAKPKAREEQIYPPPGHPYLYQLPPYSFDLDDCFEDEYDEVDDVMFSELKRELEREQLQASGEIEC